MMHYLRATSGLAGRMSMLYECILPSAVATLQSANATSLPASLITLSNMPVPSLPSGRPPACSHLQQRHMFSIPGFTDDVTAQKYHEKKLLGYSPTQMFAVVTAVEHYHKFVPWCQRSKILVRNKDHTYLEAELEVGFQVFSERYVSKVTMEPPHTVHSEVADTGLFSHLKNRWHFEPGQHPDTTWVTFEVDFAFKSPLYSHIASLFLEEVVRRMVGAFEGRCRELYGPSSLGRVVGGSGDAVRSSKH